MIVNKPRAIVVILINFLNLKWYIFSGENSIFNQLWIIIISQK